MRSIVCPFTRTAGIEPWLVIQCMPVNLGRVQAVWETSAKTHAEPAN